ncbi:MAG: peroxiredoxin [Cyanobacteriota bacterium]|nr:peroxiredoxin [Cyanobacteriota bacterium]
MNRRTFLRWFPPSLVAGGLAVEGLLQSKSAFALGGEGPGIGDPAPAFSLPGVAPAAKAGSEPGAVNLSLADFHDRWLVLYFYPKDFTPGCTLEARGFQKDLATFHQLNAEVVGVSTDTLDSHGSFCGSEGLAYPLLSDPKGDMIRRYGSWLAPSALRHTFLIDPTGIVRARWLGVRPLGHSQEVIAAIKQLQLT